MHVQESSCTNRQYLFKYTRFSIKEIAIVIKKRLPFSSLMVAYLLLAKGQDWRLQRPVTLYWLRQKVPVGVLYKIKSIGECLFFYRSRKVFTYLTL